MALDRTTKGVLLGFASFAVFSFSDACVKLIRGQLPPYESAFFGAVFGLTILPFLLRRGDHWIDILSTTNLPLWFVRFLAYPMGVIGSVTAFNHLSMAEAFVLIFLQPAYITVMSVYIVVVNPGGAQLGQHFRPYRVMAQFIQFFVAGPHFKYPRVARHISLPRNSD